MFDLMRAMNNVINEFALEVQTTPQEIQQPMTLSHKAN